ncbi:MAG: bifunctional folylpolyglutamate synthase/dihydrofolate synthase [Lentisphaerae bacterium]|nr:bifunctional folylpolyglutamate synthase/dihydrofolate synthase [Lentisphaerota bacterium]
MQATARKRDSNAEAMRRLYARRTFGIKLGLDTVRALLERLGNPHLACAVIHVAGTNGKGSVCALAASILRAAGIRAGLNTSPHLVRFNERIMVDGRCITDEELGPLVAAVEAAAEEVTAATGHAPTFFECATAMALRHFRDAGARMVVLETGMGGRLDATNVVQPALTALTRISIDHSAHLGPDIASIAAEKCGILKPGVPVVCGATDAQALDVIRREARRKGCPLVYAPEAVSIRAVSADAFGQKVAVESANASYGTVKFGLAGAHQLENLAIAVAAIETLGGVIGVSFPPEAVREGIASVWWPARFQAIRRDPPVIVDGAHNPGAGEALARALAATARGMPVALIAGLCADKDARGFFEPFKRLVRQFWAVPIESERSTPPERILEIVRPFGWPARAATLASAMDEAIAWARAEKGLVCVAGSLFLAGEVLRREEEKN